MLGCDGSKPLWVTYQYPSLSSRGRFTKVLGIHVKEEGDTITLSQPNYVEMMLKDFELEDFNFQTVPSTEWLSKRKEHNWMLSILGTNDTTRY